VSSINPWLRGARPKTLPAAIAPVLVATAYAANHIAEVDSSFAIKAIAALIVGVSLQVAVNYANDYSDGIRGTDEGRVGPQRLVGSGLKSAESVKRAAYLAFLVAMIAGSYLAVTRSLWLFLVGIVAIMAAWGYTGGKNPYGYRGLGEISVFIFFGLVATIGTFFVLTGDIDLTIIGLGSAMGAIACGILLLNNIRDIEGDRTSGKRTLSVRIGSTRSLTLYWLLLFLSLIIFVATAGFPLSVLLLLTLPLLVKLRGTIRAGELIKSLELTGKFQIQFALLLSIALLWR
jgi:1,4-dihydroxy-2-naphthoate polyprenyltransferase